MTSEKTYFNDIGNEKKYPIGIVVLLLPEGVREKVATLTPLAKKADEAIRQVQKGEMLLVHTTGQIEKVTCRQLNERARESNLFKNEKSRQKILKGDQSLHNGIRNAPKE